jgi:hypothetical protein
MSDELEELWYSGLRVVDHRAVDDSDREARKRFFRDRLQHLVISVGAAPALLIGGFLLSTFVYPSEVFSVAPLLALMALVLFRPWRTAPAYIRQMRQLRRDAAATEVVICEGLGGELVFVQDESSRVAPRILVHGSRDESLRVELLPESGAILTINGVRVERWNPAVRSVTAVKSAHARAAANFLRSSDGELALGRRTLSEQERRELEGHAPRPSPIVALLLLLLVVFGVSGWWNALANGKGTILLPAIALGAALYLFVPLRRRWRIHRRFAADLRLGEVVILRQQEEGVPVGATVELLPHAQMIWTENDAPAAWRRLPLTRPTFFRKTQM